MALLDSISVFLQPPDPRPVREIDDEIIQELEFHLEMRARDNVLAGMSEADARADALRRFGDFEGTRRLCRRTQLGERIVLQRMQTVLTLVLLAAVVVLGWQFYAWRRANETTMSRMLEKLEQMADKPAVDGAAPAVEAMPYVENSPPAVVKTVPATGDMAVDPSLTEIRVVFSKPMLDGSWSWSEDGAERFPQTTGEPRYLGDKKTCVLPVKLEADHEYLIWLNSQNFGNFKDQAGRSALPYRLHFRTRGAPGG